LLKQLSKGSSRDYLGGMSQRFSRRGSEASLEAVGVGQNDILSKFFPECCVCQVLHEQAAPLHKYKGAGYSYAGLLRLRADVLDQPGQNARIGSIFDYGGKASLDSYPRFSILVEGVGCEQ
jgi:hypothetical protein